MNHDTKEWVTELPEDPDLVVAIPRSGLLPASLIALHLDTPVADLDGFTADRILATGERYSGPTDVSQMDNVLVVDDSVRTGAQMEQARAKIRAAAPSADVSYGAVYVTREGIQYVDTYYEVIEPPRVFEWNLMHNDLMLDAAVDLDGVLCRDPQPKENDDGENYSEFIRTVKPRIIPSYQIGHIVTNRLEKYRRPTEEWLEKNGIAFGDLWMRDLPDKESRLRRADHGQFKANVFNSIDAELFIESDHSQALTIANASRKPVYSVENNQMIRQPYLTEATHRAETLVRRFHSSPLRFSKKALRFVYDRVRQ